MRPLIILGGPSKDLFDGTIAEVSAAGWTRHDSLVLESDDWDVTEQKIVVTGAIQGAGDVGDALLSVARGAGLVAALDCDSYIKRHFLSDLHRIGPVELRTEMEESPILKLTEDQLRLLEYIATGSTVAQAAVRINRSRRTTDRLLKEARTALGAERNAEAAVLLRQRLERWRSI